MTAQPPPRARWALFAWLALAGAGLLWAYWSTFAALERRWAQDPQYTHGYVVPVFALIVLWFRRQSFPAREVRPSWWGVPALVAGAGLRLAGAYFYLPWLDAGSLLPSLAGLVLVFGGAPALRWAWPGVAFLLFLVPLPHQADIFLANPLRRVATLASTYALQTLGVPALAEGNVIVMDELKVGVVEACSGLGMLMTFFALSTAVAFVIQRPLLDRAVVFLSAVPVAVLMNVARITVTVFLFRVASARLANAVFHDVAGWVMMPLALAVLWLELRFLSRLFVEAQRRGPVRVPLARGPARPPGEDARPIDPRRLVARKPELLEAPDAAP
jgi:exosortase